MEYKTNLRDIIKETYYDVMVEEMPCNIESFKDLASEPFVEISNINESDMNEIFQRIRARLSDEGINQHAIPEIDIIEFLDMSLNDLVYYVRRKIVADSKFPLNPVKEFDNSGIFNKVINKLRTINHNAQYKELHRNPELIDVVHNFIKYPDNIPI